MIMRKWPQVIFNTILLLGYPDEMTKNIGDIIEKGNLINGDIP
jgi:hypothetical protein